MWTLCLALWKRYTQWFNCVLKIALLLCLGASEIIISNWAKRESDGIFFSQMKRTMYDPNEFRRTLLQRMQSTINSFQLPPIIETTHSSRHFIAYKRFLAHYLKHGSLMCRFLALYILVYWTYSNYPNLARYKFKPGGTLWATKSHIHPWNVLHVIYRHCN